jgi:hypothetical protein
MSCARFDIETVTPSDAGGLDGGVALTAVTSTLREIEDTLLMVDIETSRYRRR